MLFRLFRDSLEKAGLPVTRTLDLMEGDGTLGGTCSAAGVNSYFREAVWRCSIKKRHLTWVQRMRQAEGGTGKKGQPDLD